MPKIMFRPNPTPPPFEPPVPPVPTDPYVTMSPFPFASEANVTCRIFNVPVSVGATEMRLLIYDEHGDVIEETVQIESPIVGEFSIRAVSIISSSNNMKGMITYSGSEGEMESYDLIVYQP